MIERVERAVKGGALQPYFQRIEDERKAKVGERDAMALWQRTGISDAYDWQRAYTYQGKPHDEFFEYHQAVSALNRELSDAYDQVTDLCDKRAGEQAISAALQRMSELCGSVVERLTAIQNSNPAAVAEHQRATKERLDRRAARLGGVTR
jgi:hypothetical protein